MIDRVHASVQPTAELLLEDTVSNLLDDGRALQDEWQKQHEQSGDQQPVSASHSLHPLITQGSIYVS